MRDEAMELDEADASRPWLLHLDDGTRRLALAIVEGTLVALAGAASPGHVDRASVTVARAAAVGGRTRGVAIDLEAGRLRLAFAAKNLPSRDRFQLLGPVAAVGDAAVGSRGTLLATLDDWRVRLTPPASQERIAAAGRVESGLTDLLLGAVESLRVPWRMARLYPHAAAGHSIYLGSEAAREPWTFASDPRDGRSGTISPELAEAITAVLGDDVHVSEWHARSPGEMPGIQIGLEPSISIRRGDDAMMVLRAIAALPAGARLATADPR